MDHSDYEDVDGIFDLKSVPVPTKDELLSSLISIEKQRKELDRQKRYLLSNIAEEGKSEKIYDAMLKVHKGILEADDSKAVSDIIADSLGDEDELKFLLENRNSNFYKSLEVFDKFSQHPEQKVLVKKKHINKRGMKRQKTPSQHISYVKDAKDTQSRFARMELELLKMQQQVTAQNTRLQMLEIKQAITYSKITKVDDSLSALAVELSNKVDDTRKITAYLLHKEKGVSADEISKVLSVPKRTIYRWIADFGKEK